jgi:hypothetical protein
LLAVPEPRACEGCPCAPGLALSISIVVCCQLPRLCSRCAAFRSARAPSLRCLKPPAARGCPCRQTPAKARRRKSNRQHAGVAEGHGAGRCTVAAAPSDPLCGQGACCAGQACAARSVQWHQTNTMHARSHMHRCVQCDFFSAAPVPSPCLLRQSYCLSD